MTLDNRTAIVTGATSTIGRAICLEFARRGAKVVVADRDAEAGGALAEAINSANGHAHYSAGDVTDEDQVQALIGDAILAFGGLDVLVNAATARVEGDALSITREDWDQALAVNVSGPWLCARYAVPFIKASTGGAIVNIAYTHAERTMPRRFAHATTQAAVAGMTRSMAVDFGPQGIRVNTLLLGWIQSDHTERRIKEAVDPEHEFRRVLSVHPLGRVGTSDEAARAAAFLASSDASFITGATLVVDGGRAAVIQDLHDWT